MIANTIKLIYQPNQFNEVSGAICEGIRKKQHSKVKLDSQVAMVDIGDAYVAMFSEKMDKDDLIAPVLGWWKV